jgi:hypothetical protein
MRSASTWSPSGMGRSRNRTAPPEWPSAASVERWKATYHCRARLPDAFRGRRSGGPSAAPRQRDMRARAERRRVVIFRSVSQWLRAAAEAPCRSARACLAIEELHPVAAVHVHLLHARAAIRKHERQLHRPRCATPRDRARLSNQLPPVIAAAGTWHTGVLDLHRVGMPATHGSIRVPGPLTRRQRARRLTCEARQP